jgi:AraC-like DNA-binding protein
LSISELSPQGAFCHGKNLVCHQPVRNAVDGGRGFGVRGIDQAEDLSVRLVNPIAEVVDVVLVLIVQVGLVRVGRVVQSNGSVQRVHIHKQRHRRLLLVRLFGLLVMTRLHLDGAIFLRAEYTEPWAYESPGPDTANMLHPGAERVILFHVVADGECWVAVDGGQRHWAQRGDVIVLPYGDSHAMGGAIDAERVSIFSILRPPPWPRMPVIRHGSGGSRTDVVCGYLHCDDPLFDPRLRAFPPVFVVRPAGAAANWVRATIAYAMQETAGSPSPSGRVPTRVPEFLLVEVLRLHLSTAPAAEHGWVAALGDPVLGPAMALQHRMPEHKWTVSQLVQEAAVSRSLLDARFRQVLGRAPIRYLTEWRMQVAQDLLATTDLSIVGVARRVGYDAEEAFSRAFKRERGSSPGRWRARQRAHQAVTPSPGAQQSDQLEVAQLLVGEQSRPDQEPHALGCFDGESAAAAGHDVDGEMRVLPVRILADGHPERDGFVQPDVQIREVDIGLAGDEVALQEAHR